MDAFALDASEAYLPLLDEDFAYLFEILRGNLRSVLSYSDEYCQSVADGDLSPESAAQKRDRFRKWLHNQGQTANNSVQQELRPRARKVFNTAIANGGIFSPSDFEAFEFNSIAAFRPSIRDLEAVGVLVSTQDDGDKRRKTIQVTPKGWLVSHFEKSQ